MSDQRGGGIAWTEQTWNPVRGCSRVSPGCVHCYAETMAARFCGEGQPYEGLARRTKGGPRWTGEVRLVPEHLGDPLRWRRPRMVFVNSMSDLFHEKLSNEQIAAVFGVMAAAPRHTFQVLTKRAARMREWFAWRDAWRGGPGPSQWGPWNPGEHVERLWLWTGPWPLPNVWLGVSAEDQKRFDARVPILLDTPAAVRWVSAEPLLGPLDLRFSNRIVQIDWIVFGGESGPHARPCYTVWISWGLDQCREAGVPAFVKQLGSRVVARSQDLPGVPAMYAVPGPGVPADDYAERWRNLRHPNGGDPLEWAEALRVREWPRVRSSAAGEP